jgi:hypothetical protein
LRREGVAGGCPGLVTRRRGCRAAAGPGGLRRRGIGSDNRFNI